MLFLFPQWFPVSDHPQWVESPFVTGGLRCDPAKVGRVAGQGRVFAEFCGVPCGKHRRKYGKPMVSLGNQLTN